VSTTTRAFASIQIPESTAESRGAASDRERNTRRRLRCRSLARRRRATGTWARAARPTGSVRAKSRESRDGASSRLFPRSLGARSPGGRRGEARRHPPSLVPARMRETNAIATDRRVPRRVEAAAVSPGTRFPRTLDGVQSRHFLPASLTAPLPPTRSARISPARHATRRPSSFSFFTRPSRSTGLAARRGGQRRPGLRAGHRRGSVDDHREHVRVLLQLRQHEDPRGRARRERGRDAVRLVRGDLRDQERGGLQRAVRRPREHVRHALLLRGHPGDHAP